MSAHPIIWDEDTEGTSEVIGGNIVTTDPSWRFRNHSSTLRQCEVFACGRKHYARRCCAVHYGRRLRAGTL
jgi:hypothetical protein